MGTRISVWAKCGWRHSFRALRGAFHQPCARTHRALCRDSVHMMSKMRSTQFCLELPREFPELGFLRQPPVPLCPPPPVQRAPQQGAGPAALRTHPRGLGPLHFAERGCQEALLAGSATFHLPSQAKTHLPLTVRKPVRRPGWFSVGPDSQPA